MWREKHGDQKADDFIPYNRRVIRFAEFVLGDLTSPHTEQEQREDDQCVNDRRKHA